MAQGKFFCNQCLNLSTAKIGHEYLLPKRYRENGEKSLTWVPFHGRKRFYIQSRAVPLLLLFATSFFFKHFLKIYLFMAALGLRCSAWASHCGGFSCCRAWALGTQASVVVAHGLRSCGLRALERKLSSCGVWT